MLTDHQKAGVPVTVLGTSHYHIEDGEGDPIASVTVMHRPEGYSMVSDLWVKPGHRGKGYAWALMEQVVGMHGWCRDLWLEPSPYTNAPRGRAWLVAFYERHGFGVVGGGPFMVRRGATQPSTEVSNADR